LALCVDVNAILTLKMSKKCTEFCARKCDGDHHAVLLSLIKVRNKETLAQFRQLLRAYLIHGFKLDRGVPDARPSFRYPLLHWAAVLGKVEALKMLLKPPFKVSPTLKTDSHETALHRLLNVMDKNIKPSKVYEMVELLATCLDFVDEEKNTPYHVCADALITCSKCDLELWKQVFYKMIDCALDKEQLVATLNLANSDGETALHMLSKRDEMIDLVEYLLCLGVDISVTNTNGESAVEVAWRFSMPIYNFYHLIESTGIGEIQGRNKSFTNKLNISCSSEPRTTRASLGLSETKDYTEFFKEEAISENENCSGDDDNCTLKRKLTHMNASLIDRLNEISEKGEPTMRRPKLRARSRRATAARKIISPLSSISSTSSSDASDEIVNNKTYKRQKRKKYQIYSDSSDSDEDERRTNPNQQQTMTTPDSGSDEPTEENKSCAGNDGQQQKSLSSDEDESLDEEQLLTKIKQTVENIKALYDEDEFGKEKSRNYVSGM